METPPAFWLRVENHWSGQQQPDGGWAYLVPPGALKASSYGSMTAAGLATMGLVPFVSTFVAAGARAP